MGIAIVVGWSLAEHLEPKVAKIAPWAIICGLVGARIWHVVDLWAYYSQNLSQIVAVWNGGMSIWGGWVGGIIGFLIGERREERGERWRVLGAVVTAMPLGQAIGRIANGVNGEFVNRVWILPWWGMEGILDLILFGMLWGLTLPAQVKVVTYLVGYGLIRVILQPYR